MSLSSLPNADQMMDVTRATWPAARSFVQGGVMFREGRGGGSRVSSASLAAPALGETEIAAAENTMRDMGQHPQFQLGDGQDAFDAQLAARGYAIKDPTVMYAAPIAMLTDIKIPRVTTFCIWEPLAIMREIWAQGGIGPERIAVMNRAAHKTGILARWNEKPAGAAFAAVHDGICMVHAVEVLPHQRRMGVAVWMMRQAAFWGQSQGAHTIALLTTQANTGANALYQGLGFQNVGGYHYRRAQE